MKSQVKVRPTKNCLVALSEFPFFVLDLKDIESVHFERVDLKIKNFDMAVIYKDFQTFKRINSIPREEIDNIKMYLNTIGIIYSEGMTPLNWNNVLSHIREEFEAFLEEGGWNFLQTNDPEGDENGESEEDDPEFVDDGSDFSEEDDDESEYSEEDESESDDDFDEVGSEGEDWDDMHKKAYEEDKQAAMRRQQHRVKVARKK
mmetsp:Transcript_1813/g.2415  ORF Transcript_1813/g.2415 Transcript_1813/m.2415 type:complete len:203 (-) Transcript_1813:15-623(-)